MNLLCEVPGDYQIRFMTSHPKDAGRKLIDTIAAQEHLCKHIHLPVQSGSDRLLKEMNRHYNVAQYMDLIRYAKEKTSRCDLLQRHHRRLPRRDGGGLCRDARPHP